MTEAFRKLKSGTDVRGVAIADAGESAQLTEEIGAALGHAYTLWLAERTGKNAGALTLAVGRDPRLSGPALARAMMEGMLAAGAHVLDCGLCTTPAMFMATKLAGADGAVMVTASHLPWRRNGYKFFTGEAGLSGAQVAEVLEIASGLGEAERTGRQPERLNFLSVYMDFLEDMIRKQLPGQAPLKGLHVAVDAGNGAGGMYAGLLKRLGADTKGSQFLNPDGRFPNHIPNPEDPAAIHAVAKATLNAKADMGVIFDADCDRMALVDHEGREVNRNRLIALVSALLLKDLPGATIVTDSVTSAGLSDFIREMGGVHHRFKRGYRNVIDEAQRLCAEGILCPLAIETSGHAALQENYFLDDGMYLATRLIIEAARPGFGARRLFGLTETLREPVEQREVRLKIHAKDFRPVGEAAVQALLSAIKGIPRWQLDAGNREGVRVQCGKPDRWFLLRLSLHDPVVVLNLESDEAGGVAQMAEAVGGVLSVCEGLDLSGL